jgi:hypothetical protein
MRLIWADERAGCPSPSGRTPRVRAALDELGGRWSQRYGSSSGGPSAFQGFYHPEGTYLEKLQKPSSCA